MLKNIKFVSAKQIASHRELRPSSPTYSRSVSTGIRRGTCARPRFAQSTVGPVHVHAFGQRCSSPNPKLTPPPMWMPTPPPPLPPPPKGSAAVQSRAVSSSSSSSARTAVRPPLRPSATTALIAAISHTNARTHNNQSDANHPGVLRVLPVCACPVVGLIHGICVCVCLCRFVSGMHAVRRVIHAHISNEQTELTYTLGLRSICSAHFSSGKSTGVPLCVCVSWCIVCVCVCVDVSRYMLRSINRINTLHCNRVAL